MMLFGVLVVVAIFWFAQRSFLVDAGRQALAEQPDAIEFRRVPGDAWDDLVTAEWLSKPLREKGFVDLGVYHVLPLIGVKLGVMINEKDGVAAFLCERSKALGISLELNVRYADGTTMMLINRADNGVPKPPFFRVIFDSSGASSGALYERLLRERSSAGIKAITKESVFAEYQSAWSMMMRWEKGRGLSAEEVFTIAAIARDGLADPGLPGEAKTFGDTLQVQRDGNASQIAWKWGSPVPAILLFIAAIGWYGLNRFLFGLGGPVHDPSLFWSLLPVLWSTVPAAGYAYCGLVILLNSVVIRIDPVRLTVRHGPLPWLGAQDVLIADIGELRIEGYVSRQGRGGNRAFYRVKLIRKNGKELKLLPGASDSAKVELIVQQLNGFLSAQHKGLS